MSNSAENSQISQNLSQNSQNDNFANAKFTYPQTAGTRALTDTQNLANSQCQNAQTAQDTEQTTQNPINQNENSQISVNLATQNTQNSANTPKNSLENYKKLDYETLNDDEKSEGYIFHILTDKISESTRQKLTQLAQNLSEIYPCEIEIHACNTKFFKDFPLFGGNHLAYFRILAPNFMPQNAKICLYLDTDMLAMQDLRALFTLDLRGKVVGVVKDWLGMSSRKLRAKSSENRDFSFPSKFYFNSGFLLINLREWRKQGIEAKAFDFLGKYEVDFPDQDALNFAIPEPLALTLPCEFNLFITAYDEKTGMLDYSAEEVEFALENPTILHIYGGEKPWARLGGVGKLRKIQWWLVALQTPFFADELIGTLANILQADCSVSKDESVEKSEFARLKELEHFGGFVKFYTRKQLAKIRRFFAKIRHFLAKIRRKTRFIRYPTL